MAEDHHIEFGWETGDGLRIFAQGWRPPERARSVICLVHGLGEHSGRYEPFANRMVQARHTVLTFDLRGHGRSEGQRGHAPGIETLDHDIERLLAEAAERFPDLPRILYGQSMGATLVLLHALRRRDSQSGAIASSPYLRPTMAIPRWKRTLAELLYSIWPSFSMPNGIRHQDLSGDPAVGETYERDPLKHGRVSVRLGVDLLRSGPRLLRDAGRLAVPLLVLHGSEDRITSSQASREFALKAGGACTLEVIATSSHELHNDPDSQRLFEIVTEWIDRLVPAPQRNS